MLLAKSGRPNYNILVLGNNVACESCSIILLSLNYNLIVSLQEDALMRDNIKHNSDVPETIYKELNETSSGGKYFNAQIKEQFGFDREV